MIAWGAEGMVRGLVLTVMAVLLAALPAQAAPYDDCMQNEDRARKIKGCTQALANKKLKPGRRSNAALHRGYAYRLDKEYDKAFADIEEVMRLSPGSGRAYYERGMLHRQREDYYAAIRDFDIAVRRMADKPFVWLARGRTNYLLENHWQAMQDLDEAIRLDPDYSLAFAYRARVRCKQNRPDFAMADWEQMHRLDPSSIESEQAWLVKRGFLDGAVSGNRDQKMIAAQAAYAQAGCPGR